MARENNQRATMGNVRTKTTTQIYYTLPIELIPRFEAIAAKKMLKPSHLLTTLILEFVESQEKINN